MTKFFLGGSGSDMFGHPAVIGEILKLTGKSEYDQITVLYLGTAAYDSDAARGWHCDLFEQLGVKITEIRCVYDADWEALGSVGGSCAGEGVVVLWRKCALRSGLVA